MNLYLYRLGESTPLLEIKDVANYTADAVVTESGETYAPLAEDCELSSVPECTETLRADWRKRYPSQETRLEELEELVCRVARRRVERGEELTEVLKDYPRLTAEQRAEIVEALTNG